MSHDPKAFFFMIFPFPQFGFRIIDGFFCFLDLLVSLEPHEFCSVCVCVCVLVSYGCG